MFANLRENMRMQRLLLTDDLFESLLNGSKKGTIRKGNRDIVKGKLIFEATNGTYAPIVVNIKRVEIKELKNLTEDDLEIDGFKTVEEVYNSLKRFYPDIKLDTIVTVIEW